MTGTNGKTGTAIATQVIDADGNVLVTQDTSLYGALIAGTPALGNGHIKKKVVKSIDKLNNSDYTTTSNSEIDETSDYLWLFSSAEVWYNYGVATDSTFRYSEEAYFVNSTETTYQRTKNMQPNDTDMPSSEGISIYQYYINAGGSSCWLWLRSPYYNTSYHARLVNIYGCYADYYCYSYYSRCAPGFVVG